MRVASNKISSISAFYFSELKGHYDVGEIESLLALAAEHYLGFSRSDVLKKADHNINQSELIKLYDCCKALKNGNPLQYILGETLFYHLKFKVNPTVLIPRPETEELVDVIVLENKQATSFLDIGTGSGCIPVSLKSNFQNAQVFACDISAGALKVASDNARLNGVSVNFFEADILNLNTFCDLFQKQVDVIVSNPPYIKTSEKNAMSANVLEHEPHQALFVDGEDPVIFYKQIIDLCGTRLQKKGRLYFELNPLTAQSVLEYANNTHLFQKVELMKDMSGKTRFLKAVKN